jgi:prepilin signal peptidase PulO-like enzyme (type II secretory pathway)
LKTQNKQKIKSDSQDTLNLMVTVNRKAMRVGCYEFKLRLCEAATFPVYKGSSFHGALGQSLAKISTRFRDSLYNPPPPDHWTDRQQKPPPPYLLIPPQEEKTEYEANDTLILGIALYGVAVDYFMIIFAALEHLGEFMGFGNPRGRFIIEYVKQINPEFSIDLYRNNQWLGQASCFNAAHFFDKPICDIGKVRIKHITRLRLKSGNNLIRTPPPFHLLISRLLGRINALSTLYGNGIVITPEEKKRLLLLAGNIILGHSTLTWSDWQRYSKRTESAMPFGGLLGDSVYSGEMMPFIPWLALGQWVGIGGKTSFGLGRYELEIVDA